jgi:hypothetical protein
VSVCDTVAYRWIARWMRMHLDRLVWSDPCVLFRVKEVGVRRVGEVPCRLYIGEGRPLPPRNETIDGLHNMVKRSHIHPLAHAILWLLSQPSPCLASVPGFWSVASVLPLAGPTWAEYFL